jgi:hypothetical protein
MSKSHKTWPFSVIVGLIITSAANAQNTVIDFETVSGSPPSAGDPITDQFLSSHGIEFGLINRNDFSVRSDAPIIAAVGHNGPGFVRNSAVNLSSCDQNTSTPNNVPIDLDNNDCRFLTMRGSQDKALIIRYDNGVSAASGEILDIDLQEMWRIRAYASPNPDAGDTPVSDFWLCSSELNNPPAACDTSGTGDGVATPFTVSASSGLIQSVVISHEGRSGAGLGFDNFTPDADATPPIQPCCAPWDNARLNESITGEIPGAGNTYPLYWTTLPQVDQQMQAHVDYANLLNPGITHVDLTLWVMDCNVNQFAGDPPCAMLNNVVELYTVRWSAGGSAPEYFHQSTPGGLSFSSTSFGVGAQLSGSQDVFSHIAFRENNYYAIYGMVWTNLDPSPIANFGDDHSLGGCEATLWRINLQEQFMRQARDRAGSARRGAAIPLPRAAIIVGEETVSRERVREPMRGIPRRPQERPGREGQRRQPQ